MPADAPVGRQLAARAVVVAAGTALAALPERPGERRWVASLRSAGLLRAGAAGGAVHDLGRHLRQRSPARRAIRPLATSVALTGGLAFLGRPAAAGKRGRRGAVAAAADDHPAGHHHHLLCSRNDGDGPVQEVRPRPRRAETYFGPGWSKGVWVPWRRLLPGAVCGAVGWSVLQTLGVYVVDRQLERANLIYGVFAVVIVLLSWLYLSARLLLYAAEVNVVLARRLWPRSLLQPPLAEPDRRVLTALIEAEERRPEQSVEVTFAPEADGRHGTPPPPRSG